MELILVQVVILVFLLTYLWAEEQATVYVTYNVVYNANTTPEYVWDAYWREQDAKFYAAFDKTERDLRHAIFTRKLTGV